MVKVSQITTVYNVEEWLDKCIQSFLNQTLIDSELILINDKSPDKCDLILNKYKDNPRIKIINNEVNVGPGVSRQIGIDHSVGEYTIFVDGDDYLEHDCLQKMYEEAIANQADMVSCRTYQHNDYGLDKKHTKEDVWIKEDFYNFINNKLIKREIWSKTNYSPLRFREDINTLFRCLEFANKCIKLDYIGYHYNLRPNSLTSTDNIACKSYIYNAIANIENINFAKEHIKNPTKRFLFYYSNKQVYLLLKMALAFRKSNECEEEIKQVKEYLINTEYGRNNRNSKSN